jgi:subtilisin family serine protease
VTEPSFSATPLDHNGPLPAAPVLPPGHRESGDRLAIPASADDVDRLAGVVADKGLEKIGQRLKWPLLLAAAFATYTGYNAWSDFNAKIGAFQKSADEKLLEFDRHASERVDKALQAALESRQAELSELTTRMRKESADAVIAAERARLAAEASAAQIEREAKSTIDKLQRNAAAASQTLEAARTEFLEHRDVLVQEIEKAVHDVDGPNRSLVGSKPAGSASGLVAQAAMTLIGVTNAIQEAGPGAPVKVAILATGVSIQALNGAGLAGHVVAGRSFIANESTEDKQGHGTRVASLVAAIAPRAQIVPLKVLSDNGAGADAQVLAGLNYALTVGARVVILPLGQVSATGGCGSAYAAVLKALRTRGVLVVAAAGNSSAGVNHRSPVATPANCPGAFAVTATDLQDKPAEFANSGPEVALAAPGQDIVTVGPDAAFQSQAGTSFSTAIAGGVAALLWSSRPDLTLDDIETILKRSAKHLEVPANEVGAGRVDALAAVRLAKTYKSPGN